MKRRKFLGISCTTLAASLVKPETFFFGLDSERKDGGIIPTIHVADLYHPHGDPDDHYDLATLYALNELNLRCIIIDEGLVNDIHPGSIPVSQMNHITRRKVPCVSGLAYALKSRTDQALDQDDKYQTGVKKIISTLRESKKRVLLSSAASCRDIAVAFNREPDLLRNKVRALVLSIGQADGTRVSECNVKYDPLAWLRLLESGLPIVWSPCSNNINYSVSNKYLMPTCTKEVRNFFLYCLTQSSEEPIRFLDTDRGFPEGGAMMWSTAGFFHAAGREVYELSTGDYAALSPNTAGKLGLGNKQVKAYQSKPIRVTLDKDSEPLRFPKPTMEDPKPGQLTASFWDWGIRNSSGLGIAGTVCVRVLGADLTKTIKSVIIRCDAGYWKSMDNKDWHSSVPWPLGYVKTGTSLDCYFTWAIPGKHSVTVSYSEGSSVSTEFQMPEIGAVSFKVDRIQTGSNQFILETEKNYHTIMQSCLKNLLSELGR